MERKPISEHLFDLRRSVVCSVLSFAFAFVLSYVFASFLLSPFFSIIEGKELYMIRPWEGFWVRLKASFAFGFFISLPLVFFFIFSFVSPGLYRSEKRILLTVSVFAILLFTGGVILALKLLLPAVLKLLMSVKIPGVKPMMSANAYLSFCFSVLLFSGIAFQAPLIAFLLRKIDLTGLSHPLGNSKRLFAFSFLVSAIISPFKELYIQLALSIVLFVGFKIALWKKF